MSLSGVKYIIVIGISYLIGVCVNCVAYFYKNNEKDFVEKDDQLLKNSDALKSVPKKNINNEYIAFYKSSNCAYTVKKACSGSVVINKLGCKVASPPQLSQIKMHYVPEEIIRCDSISDYKRLSHPSYTVQDREVEQCETPNSRKLLSSFAVFANNGLTRLRVIQRNTALSLTAGLFMMSYEHSVLPFCIIATATRLGVFVIHFFTIH